MVDSDLLDQVQQAQAGPSNADLVGAVHDQQWANSFANTPAPEVLRANVNLADTVNRAVTNKIALQAQGDAKALDLMQKTARYKEYLDQAPLREQLLQAHVDATGATERRKAAESIATATDTAGLNNGYSDLIQTTQRGTPEFDVGMAKLLADHPHADPRHVQELSKAIKGDKEGIDYATFGAEAKQARDAAIAAGIPEKDILIETYGGHPIAKQRATPFVSPEERLQSSIEKARALDNLKTELHPPKSGTENVAATEDLMVNRPVSLAFGHLNAQGKLEPDTGDKKATHVNVSFVGPSGKIHDTGPITIAEYEAIKARVNGPKGGAPAAGPQSYDSPEDFTKAFQAAKPGEIIHYQGKPYKKP